MLRLSTSPCFRVHCSSPIVFTGKILSTSKSSSKSSTTRTSKNKQLIRWVFDSLFPLKHCEQLDVTRASSSENFDRLFSRKRPFRCLHQFCQTREGKFHCVFMLNHLCAHSQRDFTRINSLQFFLLVPMDFPLSVA